MTVALPIATRFCSATLALPGGLGSFFLDGNSKITRENGTYENPAPNAFSLPAASVEDPYAHASAHRPCPGSTPTCRASCYVRGLAKHAPDLYRFYQSNADALAECLASDRAFFLSAITLAMWIEDNAPHGFRWHVSGDVLNVRHAEWIVEVCRLAEQVPFWIYTRTLEAVAMLMQADNLAVNVSADADNFQEARSIALTHGARVCYLTSDGSLPSLPGGSVIFPDYGLRPGRNGGDAAWWDALTHEQKSQVCPTDQFGQSEAHRCGPCRKCF